MLWMGTCWCYHFCPCHSICQSWVSLLDNKWYHCAMVEALTYHGMVPTSTSNIYKAFCTIGVRSGWAHAFIILSLPTYLCWPRFWKSGVIWVTIWHQTIPQGNDWGSNLTWNGSCTSTSNTCKVFDKALHAVSVFRHMDLLSCHYQHTSWTRFWKSELKFWVILGNEWYHCAAVIEALTQDGLVPTSISNMHKEFDNLHMLW